MQSFHHPEIFNTNEVDQILAVANNHYEQQEYALAIQRYTDVLLLSPLKDIAYCMRGNCYWLMNEHESGLDDLNMAIILDMDNPLYYNNRGCCYFLLGNLELAEKDFERAIALAPHYQDALANREKLYVKMNDTQKIIDVSIANSKLDDEIDMMGTLDSKYTGATFKDLIEINNSSSEALRNGIKDFEKRNYNQAIKNLSLVLMRDSGNEQAHLYLAKAYLKIQKYQLAEIHLDRVLELNPELLKQCYFERGTLYFNQGLNEKAIQDFVSHVLNHPLLINEKEIGEAWTKLGILFSTGAFPENLPEAFVSQIENTFILKAEAHSPVCYSLYCFNKALQLSKNSDNKKMIQKLYNNEIMKVGMANNQEESDKENQSKKIRRNSNNFFVSNKKSRLQPAQENFNYMWTSEDPEELRNNQRSKLRSRK